MAKYRITTTDINPLKKDQDVTVDVEADNFVIENGALRLFNFPSKSSANIVSVAAWASGYWFGIATLDAD